MEERADVWRISLHWVEGDSGGGECVLNVLYISLLQKRIT